MHEKSVKTAVFLCFFFDLITSEKVDSTIFLQKYGYLPRGNNQLSAESYPKALKMMQKMAGIEETGQLDERTISMMRTPRCGIPDFDIEKHQNSRRLKRQNEPRFKWEEKIITFSCKNDRKSKISFDNLRRATRQAAYQWSQLADIEMIEIADNKKSMIRISAEQSNHAPCYYQFDSSTLAHAFFPPNGQIHINQNIRFSMLNFTTHLEGNSLYSVVAHEMGHALGFGHSSDYRSLMYAYDTNRKWIFTDKDRYLMRQYYGTKKRSASENSSTEIINKKENEKKKNENRKIEENLKPNECNISNPIIVFYRNEYLFFKDQWMWRISSDWNRIIMKPNLINNFFRGVPHPIDAAVVVENNLWLFIGELIYVIYGNQVLHGPLRLSDLGINEKSIDLAYEWNYFKPPSIYIWKNDFYWKLDEKMFYRKIDERYPKNIELNWANVPKNVNSAFTKNNEIHFIRNNKVFQMNSSRSVLDIGDGYPISLESMFGFCPKTEKWISNQGKQLTLNLQFLILPFLFFL